MLRKSLVRFVSTLALVALAAICFVSPPALALDAGPAVVDSSAADSGVLDPRDCVKVERGAAIAIGG